MSYDKEYNQARQDVNDMDDDEILQLGLDAGLLDRIATNLREVYPERLWDQRVIELTREG